MFLKKSVWGLLLAAVLPAILLGGCLRGSAFIKKDQGQAALMLHSPRLALGLKALRISGLFLETDKGRTMLPAELGDTSQARLADGRVVKVAVMPEGDHFNIALSAQPAEGIKKWGFAVEASMDEYFTGIMERLIDGPQAETWKPGRNEALNLRGQKIEMLVKPTLSVYAPFYLSSRGYGLFVKGSWPGLFDFCASDPGKVKVEFEGPALSFKIYTASKPAELVAAHARDAGLPLLPPKWTFTPWRWRDEHKNNSEYFDGAPVIGPYNSQVMEDVLLMNAYGIPCGVYWIDRPWGPGRLGYDDFEIDAKRLPEFQSMVGWLGRQGTKLVLWIGPFTQGQMEKETVEKNYLYPTQKPQPNNYPMIDFTNPQAKAFWQGGVAKLLKQGVAGFKLDRAEEDMPDRGTEKVHDGRTLTENRNDYPVQYLKATSEVAKQIRGDDFVLMPRAAYTGSAPLGVFWGGDISCTQWGLRASIVGVQRAAVMGYPVWGSDTCGYTGKLDREVCGRWLAFSCFTPIMEVGPTQNRAFWDMPTEPKYDAELIAIWRLYARLHWGLQNYTYECAKIAHETGKPIVRPLFLEFPGQQEAWEDWGTYLYGPDILVSPVWQQGEREHKLYLPAGARWIDPWKPGKAIRGGRWITVPVTGLHQLPLFVREGASISLGDLTKNYQESLAIAQKQPDIGVLDNTLRAQFDKMNPVDQGVR